jgi:membrane-bound lytic murein transglycosylase A
MVAQDTGSAITGPARADIYYGAGSEAGRISGRFRHTMRFVMLVPKSLDPAARGRKMPLPDPRPSEKIAKLFPEVDPSIDKPKETVDGAKPTTASTAAPPAAESKIPLPVARPAIEPEQTGRRHRRLYRDRG